MPRKSALFGFFLVLLSPFPAQALGLGEIKLNSYLNEPLNAEIVLISIQPSDLEVFRAQVASVETFHRYGLDRPDFLSGLRFRVINGRDGRPVLKVSTAAPVTEPFVTFLVEANWARGRLLREYTVLLDPPVFNTQSEPPPVSAPQSATSQLAPQAGFVPRPAPQPEPSPTPAPRRPEAAPTAGSTYGPVRRNQTLWDIADSARRGTGLSINQMMMAIYQANPEAFLGNINLLKEGSTLSLPGSTEAARISQTDATSAAKQHHESWRAGGKVASASSLSAPSSSDSGRRLRLVAPGDASQTATPVAIADARDLTEVRDLLRAEQARNSQLADDVASIRREMEETRRLFNLQSAELADLQARLSQQQDSDPEKTVAELAVAPLPGDTPPDEATTDDPDTPAAVSDATSPVPPDTTAVTPSTVADTTPPASTATTPTQSSPSFVARAVGFLGSFWPWLVGAAALIGAGVVVMRRERGDESDSWEALSQESADPTAAVPVIGVDEGDRPARAPAESTEEVEYFEDTGTFKPVDFAEASSEAESATGEFPFEDTLAGEEALKLDQSDPLAEADFHMAYGLYDQAAELVRSASERDPSRRDLKMKLLEIYFVWGNKDAFLESATALRTDIGDASDGDWDKILIMGKQICPEEAIFSGSASAGGAEGVDLQLEDVGEAHFDLLTEDSAGDDSVDLDLGEALGAAAATAASVDNVIDFDFGSDAAADDENTAVEQVRAQIEAATEDGEDTEEMDLNELGIDLDFGETGSLDEDDAFVGIDTDNVPRNEAGEIDVSEDFDELFAGLDDPTATAVHSGPSEEPVEQLSSIPAEGDKLLDTSELKVEMEELLAAGEALAEDESTERSLEAMSEDSATEQIGDTTNATASFSAEIKSLAEDAFDIDLDIGDGDTDGDSTALMEQAGELTSETDAIDEFADVPGSDDATVLAEALVDAPEDDGDSTAIIKMSSRDSDDGTVVDFGEVFGSDDDDPTQLVATPIEAGQLDVGDASVAADLDPTSDEMIFPGVAEETDDSQSTEQLETFSTDVFGGQDQTEEFNQVDLDVGESLRESGDDTTMKVAPADLALPDGDPTTANEVGTKLDLARAYMEMGDPDGARGILQEVIEEGDSGQQNDARALLKALP